jgi:membrane-bound ClpP family serine protease
MHSKCKTSTSDIAYKNEGMKRIHLQSGFRFVMQRGAAALLMFWWFSAVCPADTFTNRQSGEILHGYKTSKTEGAETAVQTTEKGLVNLNLAEWQITADRSGRNNKVVVMEINSPIMYEIETQAIENAIPRIADEGPLFILLEIDTPGGSVYLAHRICGAITSADNVQVIAYIKGGEVGGALSAGAAVALAADKLYMAQDSVIGAATMMTNRAESMKEAYGDDVGEKFESAWRARLASLAERNGRPGLLARAMVDKEIEVIEVSQDSKHLFIDPINKKPDQNLIKTWSKKGSLLTLTASEAVDCGFAESIVSSREELLRKEDAAQVEVVINDDIQQASEELKRAKGHLARIRKSVDFEIKKAEGGMYRAEALKMLRDARGEFKKLLDLARTYPDLNLDVTAIEDELNSIEASYHNMKREARRK